MTAQELFIAEINKHWKNLRDREDTIFENIGISIDANEKFELFKENQYETYMRLIHESSLYEKKKIIRMHFWDNIVGDLYEHTIRIMKEANLLEEALDSFEKSYKIENTARLILENGIFANFKNKKKEIIENIIEMCFYPNSYYENNISLLDDTNIIEEGWVANGIQWTGDRVRDIARLTRNIYLTLLFLLITPATFTVGNITSRAGDEIMDRMEGGRTPTGMDPSLRKFYDFIDKFLGVNIIFKFLNKDLYDISKLLKKVNNLESEDLKDIMRDMKVDPNKMIWRCWEKNKNQMSVSNPENAKFADYMRDFLSGKGLANFLRNPQYNNETQIALVLKSDASNPEYQKMFYDFRVCVYEKLFEIILGYAKTIYSIDDASYEIIKAANEAHKNKNFKAFFDLRPKQENEEAMFKIMRVLVSIDSIASELEKRKAELVADRYIDRFIDFLRQNIKLTYNELNQLANQRKFNEDRYKENDPTEEEKAEAIKKERFEAKRSIFET